MSASATEKEKADSALLSMSPPRDYETWKNIGISYKAAGGDLDTFLHWSGSDPDNYDEAQARRLFEHVAEDGKITAGTLYWHAYRNGWEGGFSGDGSSWKPKEATEVPKPLALEPVQQVVTQLKLLFEPGEQVNLTVVAKWDAKKRKWQPGDGGTCYARDDLIERLQKQGCDGVLDGFQPEAGVWLCQNPTDGTGRGKARTTVYRHALIESDDIPVTDQIRIMRELDLPITTLTMSGSKSVHAMVRIDADGPNHYKERVQQLHEICNEAGLKVDPANKDCGRLTRLAGIRRGTQRQVLLYTDMGAKDFHTWFEAHRHKPEDNEDESRLVIKAIPAITVFDELLELPPEVISGIIRRGGKLLIAGASKSGKSYLLIELAVAVATVARWVGFDCSQGRVLYVNLEIQEPQFMYRVYRVYDKMGVTAEEVSKNFDIANLRGKFSRIEELVDALLASYKAGDYDLVIVDPAYKVQAGSENDADAITAFCAQLDRLAEGLACTIAYTHHYSKGAQGGKNAEDRASGSGVFARDADALIDMTELAWDENVQEFKELLRWYGAVPFRLEFVLRDFKAPKPKDIWFKHPIHEEDLSGMLEDSKPRKPGGPKAWHKKQSDKALEEMEGALDAFMGERDEIDRKEFVEHIGRDARTVNKYVQQSLLFDLESGQSSATIRRVRDEG